MKDFFFCTHMLNFPPTYNVLFSSIDLPNIAASLYSTELCKRLRGFLSSSPPSRPVQHVAELIIATADFERDLDSWQVR
jgi:hypothetical protein